jgi:hypothetical protein
MLEKVATHDIQDVSALFSLMDTCARAAEGRTWHSPATQAAKGESTTPNAGPRPQVVAMAMATAATRRRRRLAATSRWPGCPLPQLQRRVGAVVVREVTNAPVSRPIVMTEA